MVNFGPLAAEIDPVVWGTPANFNSFRILAALLHGTVVVGILPPKGILPGAKFTLCPSLALSYIGSITARHSSSEHQPNFVA